MTPLYIVNHTRLNNDPGKTTDVKIFTKLKNARSFTSNRYGFIIRMGNIGNTLICFFGGFSPSAEESLKIKSILDAKEKIL